MNSFQWCQPAVLPPLTGIMSHYSEPILSLPEDRCAHYECSGALITAIVRETQGLSLEQSVWEATSHRYSYCKRSWTSVCVTKALIIRAAWHHIALKGKSCLQRHFFFFAQVAVFTPVFLEKDVISSSVCASNSYCLTRKLDFTLNSFEHFVKILTNADIENCKFTHSVCHDAVLYTKSDLPTRACQHVARESKLHAGEPVATGYALQYDPYILCNLTWLRFFSPQLQLKITLLLLLFTFSWIPQITCYTLMWSSFSLNR